MKPICRSVLALALIGAVAPVAMASESPLSPNVRLKVQQALEANKDPIVRALAPKERSILLATLALDADEPDQALLNLDNQQFADDPLVALLEAEAHRRKAVSDVERAGDYARSVRQASEKLAAASLVPGLGEAEARLHAFADKLDGVTAGVPSSVLQLGSYIDTLFVVDKGRSRLFIYKRGADGGLTRVDDEYVATGSHDGDKESEGDGRTPNGVYRFVERLASKALLDKYGPVAFPTDYPNALDTLHGKDGHGIWMHGYAEGVGRRPPRDTEGCFALPNPRLLAVQDYVHPGRSWVIVGENIPFTDAKTPSPELASIHQAIDGWVQDWESLNADAYLSHYDKNFRAGKRNLASWSSYKRRVNAAKHFIKVSLDDMTIIRDPNAWPEGEIAVVEFMQHYDSSNFKDSGRKRLYLVRRPDAPWRILIEEEAP
ncbi:MAG TPA: L,D-transpeptidase family protein [Mariprofundaceae bacterium]|nr:L,D-transpeptidase family protein [Mariprofundaceae bacterium]